MRHWTFAWAIGCASAALAAMAWLWPWTRMPVITFLSYGMAALGLSVLMRAGQVSFGHAMYALIAGYGTAFTVRAFPGADALVALAAGVSSAVVLGVVVAAFVSRYRGIFFGMLNLGISMVFYSLAGKLYTWTGGTDGLRFERPPLLGMTLDRGEFEWGMMLLALASAVLLGWAVQRYFRSSAGQIAAAIRVNETRLEYIGLSARAAMVEAYVLSSALVGVGGAMLALAQGLMTPEGGYWLRSGEYVFIAILGGAGHAIGAFLGAAVFELILLMGAVYFTNIWQIVLGATLLAVIFFAPSGLVGRFRQFRQGRAARAVNHE
ncbi:branched-chain amino acid ABC transporter permease [Castellaniella sp. GW247-6E4]|uniref:branched-chain amino acid ABC transporter permease n=1 Tax=Castellaniella sp. GW247-6E4 TaxID=3140380 RepID=UPI0033161F1B